MHNNHIANVDPSAKMPGDHDKPGHLVVDQMADLFTTLSLPLQRVPRWPPGRDISTSTQVSRPDETNDNNKSAQQSKLLESEFDDKNPKTTWKPKFAKIIAFPCTPESHSLLTTNCLPIFRNKYSIYS